MKNTKKKSFRYRSEIKSDNRMATYFEYIVYTKEFMDEVRRIRKSFNIHNTGINLWPTSTNSNDPNVIFDNTNFDIPDYLDTNEFYKEIADLCIKFGFNENSWLMVIAEYVVFDYYDSFSFGKSYGICDMKTEIKSNFSFSKALSKTHPVAIMIDPYTSLTELRDIIDKTFSEQIKPIQMKYRDPKNKMLDIRKIKDDLIPIYEYIKKNLDKSSISICGEINRKYKLDWDYTRIDKIIREKGYKRKP